MDWEHLRVDQPWGDQGYYGYTGFVWYRRHIDFVQSLESPGEVVLYMPHVRCAYEAYWNGRLLGQLGSLPAKVETIDLAAAHSSPKDASGRACVKIQPGMVWRVHTRNWTKNRVRSGLRYPNRGSGNYDGWHHPEADRGNMEQI
jgi:hypothetical protein